MITINGTYEQHVEMLHWCNENNEKLLEFTEPLITFKLSHNAVRPIITMPKDIDKWFEMNCFIGWVKEYYTERNGAPSVYGGTG